MVLSEIRHRLQGKTFEPFRIVMVNGDKIDVRHRELAHIAFNGVIYVYEPAPEDPTQVSGPATTVAIHNISTIIPIPQIAA